MRTVSVSELKSHLSQYLHEVRRGGEIQVLDRGVPVARLAGLAPSANGPDGEHRQRLVRSGLVRPGTADMSVVLDSPPLELSADIQGALAEERADRM